jgi:hypothetical protein
MASGERARSAVPSLARECVADVSAALEIDLDYTADTLPLVDHFCRGLPRDAQVLERASRTVGAYFGEVVRRRFGCRWHLSTESSLLWRLEFERCFLYFNPVGVVLELLFEGEVPGSNASFATWPDATEALVPLLDRMPPVSEEDYFKLATRFEVLETVVDFLMARKDERQPELYDAEFYARQVGTDEPRSLA